MLPGTHRNRELAGVLTCRNLLILGPPMSITLESAMSLPRIIHSQQPHQTLAENSKASGIARAKASMMKMHSPRFDTQTMTLRPYFPSHGSAVAYIIHGPTEVFAESHRSHDPAFSIYNSDFYFIFPFFCISFLTVNNAITDKRKIMLNSA